MVISASAELLRLAWSAIRLPILAGFLVLEPIVRLVLSPLAFLGVVMAFFFEFLIELPNFPFPEMLGVSLATMTIVIAYYGLVRILSAG